VEEEGVRGAPDQVRERLKPRFTSMWNTLDHGDGWLHIVDRLDRQIAEIAPDYEITQVKEKFGGLRFYIGTIHDEDEFRDVHCLISEAEAESLRTCEVCGVTEDVTTSSGERGYWVKTLCREHRRERDDRT
jgi:lysozyme family protein